jgi:acyl transferase domain-containing protein/acyl carrier protein
MGEKTLGMKEIVEMIKNNQITPTEGFQLIKEYKQTLPDSQKPGKEASPIVLRDLTGQADLRSDAGITGLEAVREKVIRILSDILHLSEQEIDFDTSFKDLGLDSISGVEIIRDLNRIFNLQLDAVVLYDHATALSLTRFVMEEVAKQSPLPEKQPLPVLPGNTFHEESIRLKTIDIVSNILHISAAELNFETSFKDFGVDSINGVEIIRDLNSEFHLNLDAVILYDYSTVSALIGLVARESRKKDQIVPGLDHSVAEVKERAVQEASITRENSPVLNLKPINLELSGNKTNQIVLKQHESFEPKNKEKIELNGTGKINLASLRTDPSRVPIIPKPEQSREIAVIGISGRYPGADNLKKFWSNLENGVDSITEIPGERWDLKQYYDPDPQVPNKTYCKTGGFLTDIDQFDPLFFNISPKEAELMDPQQRLFLQEAWHALEDAGYSDKSLSNVRCGVFAGATFGDYLKKMGQANLDKTAEAFTGTSPSILVARISYFLNLTGPSIALDTACSSSLVAIHLACQSILNQESDMAIAGGVKLMLTPDLHIQTSKTEMLSHGGKCLTFDQDADGIVLGEGIGIIILKPLSKALQDGDHIYGVIKGSGINQDGKTNGITAPSTASQTRLELEVYRRTGINPESISYVEAHGTGTKLGDPIEIKALTEAFREFTPKKRFCAVGSVKTNIGHTTMSAGVASVLKVLLSLKYKRIPPSLNFKQENEHINFQESPFYVNTRLSEWKTENNQPRRAAVSSFGFGGTNAHLVIEEPPFREFRSSTEKSCYLMPLSAKTEEALLRKIEDLGDWLKGEGANCSLGDISYTLWVGRSHFPVRSVLMAGDAAELAKKIAGFRVQLPMDHDFLHNLKQPRLKPEPALKQTGAGLINELSAPGLAESEYREKLRLLADLYLKGYDLDWQGLFTGGTYRRISLPAYPFARERYWIPTTGDDFGAESNAKLPPVPVDPQASGLSGITPGISETFFYHSVWEDRELKEQTNQVRVNEILVFDTGNDFRAALQNCVEKEGSLVISVKPGNSFRELEDGVYEINPAVREDYQRLLADLHEKGRHPERILHLWSQGDFSANGETLQAQIEIGFYSVLYLSQALMEQKPKAKIQLLYVYPGRGDTPQYAGVGGLAKTIRLENPQFLYKTVEIPPSGSNQKTTAYLGRLLREFQVGDEVEIRYEAERRQVKTLRELDGEWVKGVTKPELPFQTGGVYLITGGVGGLGMIFAKYLAEKAKVKLVLTDWAELSPEKAERIREIEALGSEVIYLRANISERKSVVKLIRSVKTRFKAINGVIHAAGVIRDSFLLKKTAAEAGAVLGPKVYGAVWLDELTKEEPLDFFVMFSSIAAILGNPGQSDYAYANSFMDGLAGLRENRRKNNQRSGKTLTVNWPLWRDGGMKISAEDQHLPEETGFEMLPSGEGTNAWTLLLNADLPQCFVCYGNKHQIRYYLTKRLIGEINPGAGLTPEISPELLLGKTEEYLKQIISEEFKLPANRIDSAVSFEEYGIDSIIIRNFNFKMEKEFGSLLSKTLLFEYNTLHELAGFLAGHYEPELRRVLKLQSEPVKVRPEKAPGLNREELKSLPENNRAIENMGFKSSNAGLLPAEAIAIIGVSGRYPFARDVDEYWENLIAKRDCITEIPSERWDCHDYYDPDPDQAGEGKIYCKWGGFLEDIDKFDPLFFNISPREAETMDPQERIFLETAWAALEDAGYSKTQLREYIRHENQADVGVFVGVTTNSYQLLGPELWNQGRMVIPTSAPWSIANRVSYLFNFHGPSIPVDTACSSSLTAIHLACDSLKKGECHLAIAGGVNLYLHPSKYIMMCQMKMLSLKGRCQSFGDGGDGFVPGEGVGAVILKPLSLAVRDQDHIYAVIKGTSVNHGGRTNGYTVPNPNAQARLILQCLKNANLDPRTLSYIEAHGTGTFLGDPVEITGLNKAFTEHTPDKQFCAIGSVKSNIGHLEAAAGIAGVTKILLQMKYKQLAPSLHAQQPNPNIDFKNSPFYLQQELEDWKQPAREGAGIPRRAGISSFGAGGANAHLILEEYLGGVHPEELAQPVSRVVVLSAKNETRLKVYAQKMVEFLAKKVGPESNPRSGGETFEKIQADLSKMVSAIINVAEKEIDPNEDLSEYGLEPLSLTSLADEISKKYQLAIDAALLAGYPTIQSLTRYLSQKYSVLDARSKSPKGKGTEADSREYYNLTNIAYTLQIGREEMEERLAVVVSNTGELIAKLTEYLRGDKHSEGLYLGNIKQPQSALKFLFEGREGEEYLKAVIGDHKLNKLAELWTTGVAVNWKLLYLKQSPARLPLPTYPFEKERYWISDSNSPRKVPVNNAVKYISAATPTDRKDVDQYLEQFFYYLRWTGASPGLNEDRTNAQTRLPENQVTMIISLPQSNGLENALERFYQNNEVIRIKLGKKTRQIDERAWEVNYEDPEALSKCLKRFKVIHQIYFLAIFNPSYLGEKKLEVLDDAQEAGVISFYRLIKGLSGDGWAKKPLTIKVITNNVHQIAPDEPVLPYSSSLVGLVKGITKEFPEWEISNIDISWNDCDAIKDEPKKMEKFILPIVFEPGSQKGEVTGLRGGLRYIHKIESVSLPKADHPPFRNKGVYLILGGTGRIGAEFADYLARTVNARLVLVGSSPLNEDIQKQLSGIEHHGGQGIYCQANGANLEEMKAVVKQAKAKFGTVNGAVHSAISFKIEPLVNLDEPTFRAVLDPKIKASIILERVLENEPLDFILFFSSGDSITAQLGHSAYVAGCYFADTFALHLSQRKDYPVRIINWGYWETNQLQLKKLNKKGLQSQLVQDVFESRGIKPIFPEAGMEAIQRILEGPEPQVLAMKVQDSFWERLNIDADYRMKLYPESIPSLIEKLRSSLKA